MTVTLMVMLTPKRHAFCSLGNIQMTQSITIWCKSVLVLWFSTDVSLGSSHHRTFIFLKRHQVWSVSDHRDGFNKCISSCLLSVALTVGCNAVFHSLYLFSFAHSLSTHTLLMAHACGFNLRCVCVCSLPAITQLLHICEMFFSDCAISLIYSARCVLL